MYSAADEIWKSSRDRLPGIDGYCLNRGDMVLSGRNLLMITSAPDIGPVRYVVEIAGLAIGVFLLSRLGNPMRKASIPRDEAPFVSVIIPARNEERNLPRLLADLERQTYSAFEVIVVDDDSDDRTLEIASSFPVKTLRVETVPEGWLGKNWACHVGYLSSRGSLLVFLDADVRLHPAALEALVARAVQSPKVISVQPHFLARSLSDSVGLLFWLVGSFAVVSKPVGRPEGLFGACIAIFRSHYESVGGHARLRNEVAEDLALGQVLAQAGIPVEVVPGGSLIGVYMHDSGLKGVYRVWARTFGLGALMISRLSFLFIFLWIAAIIGSELNLIRALLSRTYDLAALACYGVAAAELLYGARRTGTFNPLFALFHVLVTVPFVTLFTISLFNVLVLKRIQWKGRSIALDENIDRNKP